MLLDGCCCPSTFVAVVVLLGWLCPSWFAVEGPLGFHSDCIALGVLARQLYVPDLQVAASVLDSLVTMRSWQRVPLVLVQGSHHTPACVVGPGVLLCRGLPISSSDWCFGFHADGSLSQPSSVALHPHSAPGSWGRGCLSPQCIYETVSSSFDKNNADLRMSAVIGRFEP